MKTPFFFICISIATILRAQQDTISSPWQIGINLQPAFSYRMHTGFKDKGYFNHDRYKFGYDLGLNVSYDVCKHVSIESGIHYGSYGYGRLTKYYAHSPNIPLQIEETLFWNYISVPVRVNFHSNRSKLNFTGGVSLSPGYMVSKGGKGVATYSDGEKHTQTYDNVNEFDKRFNLFAGANGGIEYRFRPKMSLRAELNFQLGTLKIKHSNSSLFNLYPWNAGLNIGYYIRIG